MQQREQPELNRTLIAPRFSHLSVRIRATVPGGPEQLMSLVTRQPFKGFAKGTVRTPRLLDISHDELPSALNAEEQMLAAGSWAQAELRVEVED